MLYATGMFVPDPFIFLRLHGKNFIVMNDLEIDRARQQAPHCHVLSLSKYQRKLRARSLKQPGFAQIVQTILREKKIGAVHVPQNFPLSLALELQRLHVTLKVKSDFFAERELKSPAEVKKVSAALMMAYAFTGFAVLHTLTLALKNRVLWLCCIYAVVIVVVWPLLAMIALGIADAIFGLRQRFLQRRPPPLPVS